MPTHRLVPGEVSEPFVSLAQAGLRRGRRARFQVSGDAVATSARDGEWVTVEPIPAACVTVGDLLLASVEGAPRVRRVAAIAPRRGRYESEFVASFTLVNDDGYAEGGVVEAGDILGRVVGVDRHGRTIPLGYAPPMPPAGRLLRRGRLAVQVLLGVAALATLIVFSR
jgi:hypothetical protein